MSGISFMQITQSVAQKLTTTTLPRRPEVAIFSPLIVVKVTGGTAGAHGNVATRKIPTAAASTAARIRPRTEPAFSRRGGLDIGGGPMRPILGLFALLVISAPAAASLDRISNADAVSGLKQALNDGSHAAVSKLGVANGYFGNPQVKIPLPPSLKRVEGAMRAIGMRKQADDLVLTMNRAAEAAAPEAKQLLVDAVKKMS